MQEVKKSEAIKIQTCEPCPNCDFGVLAKETNRSQEFFGQSLPLPDIKICNICKYEEEA